MIREFEDGWPVFPSQRRNEALKLAVIDTSAALSIALAIQDHWYGSQALAWVGRFAPRERAVDIILSAIDFARKAPDPFNFVAISAWSLRALIELDHSELVRSLLPSILERSQLIAHSASKSEALFFVFQALRPGPFDLWDTAFQALVGATTPTRGWRQRRNLLHAVMMIAEDFPELAADVPSQVADEKLKRKLANAIESRDFAPPRVFFWKDIE